MKHPLLRMAVVAVSLASAVAMAALSGCAAARASLPTAEELSAGGTLPGGANPDALRRGRAIFVTECAACHRLYLPGEYSSEQWHGIIPRMARRASLSADQIADIDLYLSVASSAGK